jgi:hypothetical protein
MREKHRQINSGRPGRGVVVCGVVRAKLVVVCSTQYTGRMDCAYASACRVGAFLGFEKDQRVWASGHAHKMHVCAFAVAGRGGAREGREKAAAWPAEAAS